MGFDNDDRRWKKYYKTHLLIPRSSCVHSSQLALKLLITVRVKFQILHFCMEVALSVWPFKKKEYLEISCSQQYPIVVHKKKRKKRVKHCKIKINCLKKQHNTKSCFSPLSTSPSFSKAHCSAMRFLRSPTCALHMLLPGANETRLSYSTIFRDKKMCEHKALQC